MTTNKTSRYSILPESTCMHFLGEALKEANLAITYDEIPIGAIITQERAKDAANPQDFIIIGRGYNRTLTDKNICAHAEIIALQNAAKTIGTHRLNNCDLYVTIEPCLMCVGAILHSRIRRVIFGAIEPKTGAILSQAQVLTNPSLNHHTEVIGPVNTDLYKQHLQDFLRKKRAKNKI